MRRYAAQVDCRNGLPGSRIIDNKVMKRGDDLVLALRMEGSFTEVFELADFPFDMQGLTISMVFNCRANGPLPIDITVDPQCSISLTCVHLCPPSKEYTLLTHLHVRAHLLGHSDNRKFPGVSFTAQVKRGLHRNFGISLPRHPYRPNQPPPLPQQQHV